MPIWRFRSRGKPLLRVHWFPSRSPALYWAGRPQVFSP